jgi:hypothetical protein
MGRLRPFPLPMPPMRAMLIPILLVSLAAACTSANSYGNDAAFGPVLVNRTENALIYSVFPLEEAGLVDPNPAIDPAEAAERRVPAGEERAMTISGWPGDGVVVFIYEIPANHAGGTVPLSRTLQVTGEDLARTQGRIVVENQ